MYKRSIKQLLEIVDVDSGVGCIFLQETAMDQSAFIIDQSNTRITVTCQKYASPPHRNGRVN